MLNQHLTFHQLPTNVQRAFSGQGQKVQLNSGHQLYKFTEHPLVNPPRQPDDRPTVTPWWSSVEPILPDDTGLAGLLERSERLGVAPAVFSRTRNAVTRQWNSMSGLLIAQLNTTVVGFAGHTAHQTIDQRQEFSNVFFIGGAIQLFIPNLEPSMIRKV